MIRYLKKFDLPIVMLFFVLAVILRFFSFFPSVIDHDESTYLVIGNELTKGKILYHDITDIKPVGIFYIIAGFFKLFGKTIFGFRILGAFAISLTSYFLYLIKIEMGHPKKVAVASGIIYILFTSIWTLYGISPNTEHFFNLTIAIALFFVFWKQNNTGRYIGAFVFGIGFLIKIVVLFDFIALLLFLISIDWINKVQFSRMIKVYSTMGIIFLIPFGLVSCAYGFTGYFREFFHVNFIVFKNYPVDKSFLKLLVWLLEFFSRFLPITFFLFYALFSKFNPKTVKTNERLFVVIWMVFGLISITMPGKISRHYLIQLMLPISLYASNIFHPEMPIPRFLNLLFQPKIGYTLLGLLLVLNVSLQWNDFYKKPDPPKLVAADIRAVLKKGEVVYTGNAYQIIYFLLDVSPPTKYVHSSLLFKSSHYKALEIDPTAELVKIFKSKPRFIIEKNSSKKQLILPAFRLQYRIKKYYPEFDVTLYELKTTSPSLE
jgi:4-amino-4-deoxy-L-arabinose transferase-like glycosyltransferase